MLQEPPPRSVAWRSPWGGGALFPDPSTGSCQECADRQLASDLAAARLRTHEVRTASGSLATKFRLPQLCWMVRVKSAWHAVTLWEQSRGCSRKSDMATGDSSQPT